MKTKDDLLELGEAIIELYNDYEDEKRRAWDNEQEIHTITAMVVSYRKAVQEHCDTDTQFKIFDMVRRET